MVSKHLFAFDFDGVICDSAGEMALSAWRAAGALWPDQFAGVPDQDFLMSFRMARPVIETGHQSIVLVRMLGDGLAVATIRERFLDLYEDVIRIHRLTMEDLKGCFGQARDRWIAEDRSSWLAAHSFYDGVIQAINFCACDCCIITTKQERFTRELVAAAGLDVAPEMIFGLEQGVKEEVLTGLCESHACVHFVEDRLSTLERIHTAGIPARLYLADWGYNTEEERRRAAELPNVSLLTRGGLRQLMQAPIA